VRRARPFLVVFAGLLAMAFTVEAQGGGSPQPAGQPAAGAAAGQAPPGPGGRGGRGRGRGPQVNIFENGDFTIAPGFTMATELFWDNNIPHGTVHRFTMKSQDSKIYPGLNGPYERPVAVYIPAQYVPGTAAPFMVVQDGYSPKYHYNVPTALDKLIADKKIPVMLAVLVHHGGGDGPGSERGLEYDTVSGKYAEFIETEVLPRIERDYKVTFTKDPEGRATMGGSSGAAAALGMAWFHPEWYHRVLSYSGTFTNQARPSTEIAPRGAWEYHATLIPNSERKPLRMWMEVAEFDNGNTRDESTWGNWVIANRHMAAAFKDKGYPYRFVYAEKATHTDIDVIVRTLPEALQWLWQGYGGK